MSVVLGDPYWSAIARWIVKKGPNDRVYGPELLQDIIKNPVITYRRGKPDEDIRFAVLHKDQLRRIGGETLKQILRDFKPVFANEVFVLYDRKPPWPWQALESSNKHFVAFLERLVEVAPPLYLEDNLAIVRLSNGLYCHVDVRDQSFAPDILTRGVAHDYIVSYFDGCIRPGDVVVDLGANMGYFTSLFCERVGGQGKVIAFEANPKLVGLIHRNMEINGFRDRATIVNKAVAERCDPIVLNCFKKYQGSSTVGTLPPDYAEDEIESIEVEGITLDAYFGDAPPRIDVLKLDIQGFEPQALRGAQNLLKHQDRILVFCEFAPVEMRRCGNSPEEFLSYIEALGFNRQVLDLSGRLSQRTNEEILNMCRDTHVDLILTKGREKVAAL